MTPRPGSSVTLLGGARGKLSGEGGGMQEGGPWGCVWTEPQLRVGEARILQVLVASCPVRTDVHEGLPFCSTGKDAGDWGGRPGNTATCPCPSEVTTRRAGDCCPSPAEDSPETLLPLPLLRQMPSPPCCLLNAYRTARAAGPGAGRPRGPAAARVTGKGGPGGELSLAPDVARTGPRSLAGRLEL